MQRIGAFEAKTHFSSLLERVQGGEQIIITIHGRSVAQLLPMDVDKTSSHEAILAIKEFQSKHTLGLDWKMLRDEGRK
jgi:prevent-host-death family protein